MIKDLAELFKLEFEKTVSKIYVLINFSLTTTTKKTTNEPDQL